MKTMSSITNYRGLFTGSLLPYLTCMLFSAPALAGTINVNFTDTSPTGFPAADGTGVLGGGSWAHFNTAQAITLFNFQKNNGVASGVSVVAGSIPLGSTQANGNPLQNESWYNLVTPIAFTISGLVPNGYYALACYSDLDGVTPALQTSFVANGVSGATNNVGAFLHSIPGTAGNDYVVLNVRATGAGVVNLSTFSIAGLQIQGVLTGEQGPKMDCMITKSPLSGGGRGRNVFGINLNPKQTLSQSGTGGASKFFFINARNTGAEYDKAFLMAFPDRGTRIKIVDKTTRKNVTAAARARRYRFDINAKQTKGFTVQVSAISPNFSKSLKVGIGASPSTLRTSKQDVVNCVLTP